MVAPMGAPLPSPFSVWALEGAGSSASTHVDLSHATTHNRVKSRGLCNETICSMFNVRRGGRGDGGGGKGGGANDLLTVNIKGSSHSIT